ncbi:MAG TPA: hypothetical protein PL064_13410, partial [Thermogutta sp.]|nr:hypothetical protein [Thermogutta sp.]
LSHLITASQLQEEPLRRLCPKIKKEAVGRLAVSSQGASPTSHARQGHRAEKDELSALPD